MQVSVIVGGDGDGSDGDAGISFPFVVVIESFFLVT